MTEDHYAVLEVSADASPDVIHAAFRALSKRFHSDHNPDLDPAGHERMAQITRAWAVLGSSSSRAAYDAQRAAANAAAAGEKESTLGQPGWGEAVVDPRPYRPPQPPPAPASGYQPWGYPPAYGQASARPPLSGKAVGALCAALFGMSGLAPVLGPLAVYLALRAQRDIRSGTARGGRHVVASVLLGAAEIVACLVWAAVRVANA